MRKSDSDDIYSKKNVAKNIGWKLSERVTAQIVTFILTIIIARILDPSDFGLLAMTTVFVVISNIFITSGLSEALIQKQNADELDFSSMLYLNITVALILYAVLFIAAKPISLFFGYPVLVPLLRVLGLQLIIASVNAIQNAYAARNMMFRHYFYSTLSSKVISGIIGITMAYMGFGVWALVAQSLSMTFFATLVLWFRIGWRPKAVFSWDRVRQLYSYAWKSMAYGLLETLSFQLRALVIGKNYSSADLAYYDRGTVYPNNITTNIISAVRAVMFPVLSNAQEDPQKVKAIMSRWIQLLTFVILPIMIGLGAIANPLVIVLLTEKWVPCVQYLQIACLAYGIWILEIPVKVAVNAVGRIDITLKVHIAKNIFSIILLLLVMKYGIMAIAVSLVISNIFSVVLFAVYGRVVIHYSFKELLRDIAPATGLSFVMGVIVYSITFVGFNNLLMLSIQIISGIIIYTGSAWVFKMASFKYCLRLIRPNIKTKQ